MYQLSRIINYILGFPASRITKYILGFPAGTYIHVASLLAHTAPSETTQSNWIVSPRKYCLVGVLTAASVD
jgi:hypothetical protein